MATNSNARIVSSTRGGNILEVSGYRYTKNSSNRKLTKIYWRCTERTTCRGTCSTNYNMSSGILVKEGNAHSHEPDFVQIEVQNVVRSIKRRAEQHPNEPPSSIFREEVSEVRNEEVIMSLPERNDIIRNINRIQNRNRPPNVNLLQNLVIQPPYDKTKNGEDFHQYDSGMDAEGDRFLLFYTEENMKRLCNSKIILCDGTFRTVPTMFFQLYSIHGVVNGYTFPLIYCLSTRKTESFYKRMLDQLINHANELNLQFSPEIVMSDFELAFINAATICFPNSRIKGCLFHFTQSIWRHAVMKGLKRQYTEVQEVRNVVQGLLALPFIPVEDIEEVFEQIISQIGESDYEEQLEDLISYVERTYIRGRRGGRPRFAPTIWSCYELVINKFQRSTNSVEAWHSKFQKIIVSHHSGIWKFMEHILKDQSENEILMLQLAAGHSRIRYPVKGLYRKNQEQIERIVNNYQTYKDNGTIVSVYLKAISLRIKLLAEEVEENTENTEDN